MAMHIRRSVTLKICTGELRYVYKILAGKYEEGREHMYNVDAGGMIALQSIISI
jgi:hypothetical protein